MADDTPAVKRLSQHRIECTVTFTEAEIAPAEQAALQKLGANVKMEGFREGKVPPEMLKEKVDPSALLEETVRNLLPSQFEALTKEHDIKPVIPPKVEAVSTEPLTLKIVFVERPEVKLKGVDKIKVEKKEPQVDEKDVQQMIDYILQQHQQTSVVQRAAQAGDRVTMDFWADGLDGKEIEGIRSTDYQVIIGSQTLLPGFEDQLIGLSAGGSKDFPLTFPEKYHAEQLQNKPVTFHVTVKQVEAVALPELTDEFVRTSLGAESAEALRTQVKTSMQQQEEQIERQRREQSLLDGIRRATDVDLAPELIDDELQLLFEELQGQLQQQNRTLEQWLQESGRSPEDVHKDMREKAEQRLTLRLGIQKLVEERGIDITDSDMTTIVDDFLQPLSEDERAQVQGAYRKGERAYEQLRWQKMVEKLLSEMLKD